MMGDTSREEKLAAARKKLKHFQKKKEADKVKISNSRQSTPDSQTELTTFNGKEGSQVIDAVKLSTATANSECVIENSSKINIEENNYQINLEPIINPVALMAPVEYLYENNNQPEVFSANEVNNAQSRTADIGIAEPPTSYDDSSNHYNIQNYFNSEDQHTNNQELYEGINSVHIAADMASYFDQLTINDICEEYKADDVVQSVALELPSPPCEDVPSAVPVEDDNQLEVHTQTISILVAEKSALQSQLQQTALNLEKNNEEMLDLRGRLQLSQSKVNGLQAENAKITKEMTHISETADRSNKDYGILTSQLDRYRDMYEDVQSVNEELNARLGKECDEKARVLQELTSTKGKLELANIHKQQLRDSSNGDLTKEISSLKEVHEEAQKQILSLHSSLAEANASKISIEQEYKSYGNHLVTQLEVAYQKITLNEATLQQVMRTKEELEAKLDLLKAEQLAGEGQKCNEELNKLNLLCQDFGVENNSLKQNLAAMELDNKALSKMCVELRESLEKMEVAAERRDSNEVDTSQLLQAMQSDKVAAARALSQNKQLKEQLEELQNGFIMMSNKKLELTEKMEVEVHFKKRLQKEILELGEQISLYRQMAESKREKTESAVCDEVKSEAEVKSAEISNSIPPDSLPPQVSLIDASTQADFVELVLEDSRNCVAEALNAVYESGEDELAIFDDSSDNFVERGTHQALENRFTKCMKDLAAAQDEKQCLDHLVQRLQLETEAVGDYITIYQFQRGVMKKEVEELNIELSQLKDEREAMYTKLASLQNLIGRLTGENGMPNVLKTEHAAKQFQEDLPTTENNPMIAANERENPNEDKQNKQQTVRKIMNLISEMESTSQVDVSVLNKFHPCPLCSGKLINI